MADLEGNPHAVYHVTAAGYAVVDCGKAVEHGPAQAHGLPDAVLCLFVAILTGVAVNGAGKQVCLPLILEELQQLHVLFNHGNAGPGLDQSFTLLLGSDELLGKDFFLGEGLMESECVFQVYALAGGPLGQDLLTKLHKFAFGNLFILDLHLPLSPFS